MIIAIPNIAEGDIGLSFRIKRDIEDPNVGLDGHLGDAAKRTTLEMPISGCFEKKKCRVFHKVPDLTVFLKSHVERKRYTALPSKNLTRLYTTYLQELHANTKLRPGLKKTELGVPHLSNKPGERHGGGGAWKEAGSSMCDSLAIIWDGKRFNKDSAARKLHTIPRRLVAVALERQEEVGGALQEISSTYSRAKITPTTKEP